MFPPLQRLSSRNVHTNENDKKQMKIQIELRRFSAVKIPRGGVACIAIYECWPQLASSRDADQKKKSIKEKQILRMPTVRPGFWNLPCYL
jgi:hypothetical protein